MVKIREQLHTYMMAVAPCTGAARLRQLLTQPDTIVSAPGVFDGFSARIALAQKFDALYMVSHDMGHELQEKH